MAVQKKMRYTDAELAWIKSTFSSDDEFGLKMLRKIFYPEVDIDAPMGQVINLHATIETEGKSAEEVAIELKAMQRLMRHVEVQLQALRILAGEPGESVEKTKERLMKNSSK